MSSPIEFYAQSFSERLCFGDIIEKVYCFIPLLSQDNSNNQNLNITLNKSKYFVVLTPCCQIGKKDSFKGKLLVITPLQQILPEVASVTYFSQDLLRINTPCPPHLAINPNKWKSMSEDEQLRTKQKDVELTELNFFVYAPNPILSKYTLKDLDCYHYMIDFKNINSIQAKEPLRINKVAELSEYSRSTLHYKIAYFFGKE